MPNDIYAQCNNGSPSTVWSSFASLILAEAGQSNDLQDVEDYLIQADSVIQGYIGLASNITDYWDVMENDCQNWNNWLRYCYNHEEYCELSENSLETNYWSWTPVITGLLSIRNEINEKLAEVTAQIYTDIEQANQLAVVQQIIAETNNLISLVAYQNEVRELSATKKKTQDVFTPIILVLLLIFLGFYVFKK